MPATRTKTPRTPADRQAARAKTWRAGLIAAAPAWWGGTITVQAATRDDAWTAANLEAARRNREGADTAARRGSHGNPYEPVAIQGVSLAPLTRTEAATLDAFLSGRSVRLRADRATGLDSVEHRGGRVYVHALQRPRDLVDLDPDVMARAGAALDHRRGQGPAVGPYYSHAQREACAIRCAAADVPEGFAPTGEVAVWAWWSEPTSPTFPDTPDGRAAASRLARLHSGGRASLVLDGVTIATVHSAHSAGHPGDGWPGPFGPVLRVMHPTAVKALGPRAVRIMTALRSLAQLQRPDSIPDVELAWTAAELVAVQLDPRDGLKVPTLKADAPTIADLYPDMRDDDHAQKVRMEAPHERLRVELGWNPGDLWKLAAENPAHFDMPDVPADARKVNR